MDVPFVETTLSSSLFLLSSLREEGETSQTLVASAGEKEEGKACGKSVRVKAIFRRSFSFHPRKEYHPFHLLLAIYLTTTKFLQNRFSPSAIQTANYLRSRRSTFNTGRENTYITFVIGGEDEWLSTVAVFASYNSFNSGKMKFFRPLFLSLSCTSSIDRRDGWKLSSTIGNQSLIPSIF